MARRYQVRNISSLGKTQHFAVGFERIVNTTSCRNLPVPVLNPRCVMSGAINVQPGNVQPWWIRYGLVLFQEGRDFDSVACLQRLQSKFEDVGEVCMCVPPKHDAKLSVASNHSMFLRRMACVQCITLQQKFSHEASR